MHHKITEHELRENGFDTTNPSSTTPKNKSRNIALELDAPRRETVRAFGEGDVRSVESPYMTTTEAAGYLRKSVSWLLRQKDITWYGSKPNLYKREHLDQWMEENCRHDPLV